MAAFIVTMICKYDKGFSKPFEGLLGETFEYAIGDFNFFAE